MRKTILISLLLAALIVTLWWLQPAGEVSSSHPLSGLPWQIEILAEGTSKVFGLTLAKSTIADARDRFGPDMELALIAAPGETGALEAYFSSVTMGIFSGKLVLTAALDKETVEGLRQRARKSEYMDSSTRKYILGLDDLATAMGATIGGITFIPSASFDAEIALERFGKPGQRIRTSGQIEHLLYPEKGLAITLDSKGKELLQYVAPRQFARLRDPLLAGTQ